MAAATESLFMQAQAAERAGQTAKAESLYQRLVQLDPGHDRGWHALGILAYGAGNLPFAVQCIEAAIANKPKVALYHRNAGEMSRRLGDLRKAISAGRTAAKLAPDDHDAHYNLGLAYTDAGEFAKAVESYRRAIKIDARHGLSWNNLGSALEKMGDKAEAERAYAKAVKLNPRHAEAQNNLGAIYSERGKLDEARHCFSEAIAARADFVEAHYNLSSLKTYKADDPHLANLESVFAQRERLSEHARIRYCFALGKALDDTGQYDRAFAAYDEGNRLQHRQLPMDDAWADALLERIIRTFDEKFFADRANWQGAAAGKRTPIFIVGMPRSGTTLLEQILCSHASVHGAGELSDLNEVIVRGTGAGAGRSFTEGVEALGEADLKRIGDDYLKQVWKLSPSSRYITDKMPANFFYLGIIHLALPGARIIHAMRDPMDSCFSCFSRLFNDTMEFAYDQGTLGRYYVRYMKLMRHWHRVLPPGTILDLPYEQMVADTEGQARRVLEFVGLPWDENCLNFHANDRLVKTASVAQVRKPIYKTSVARWKHFARHLRPLYEIVKDYRPADACDLPDVLKQVALPAAPNALSAPAAGARDANSWHVEGIALYRQNRFEEALACYDRALSIAPDFPAALNSRGFLLQDAGRLEEALACFGKAVRLAPEMAMARLNLGMLQLKTGDWDNGWDNYEARWTGSAEASNGSLKHPVCPLPQWQGASGDDAGKRLLVITEQGFGDTFQFARYLSLAAGRFARVGFACGQPTQRLMEWAFGDRIVTFAKMPASLDEWDLQCPLMSLPRAFRTRPDNIPADVPYLRVPERAASYWRDRLESLAPGRFRCGIAWAGRPSHSYDARRSLSFDQIKPLLRDPRITWVSLQKWALGDRRPDIPADIDWIDLTEDLTDFADTAALLSSLDLVISIDSAMVHLAGALDKPVWMMNRFDSEWRWFRHRADSPWYRSLRIFNQPAFGDWDSVLLSVRAELERLPINPKPAKKRKSPVPVAARAPAVQAVPQESGIEQSLQLASQHQNAGRLREAEALLQQILAAQPRHSHALHLLGVVAYQAGKPEQALQLIGQAVDIEPVALFCSNLAEMHRQQGHVQEAIRYGERAVAADPALASAHGNLGVAYYDAKDYAKARACHERALQLTSQLPHSLNNLGSICRAEKNLEQAIEWYRKALAITPDHVEALSNLGAVLVESDRADEAFPLLERVLALQPDYPEGLCNFGLACLKQDRIEEGMNLLSRSLQLRPGYPEAMIGLARGLHELDRSAEAIQALNQVVAAHPDKTDAWALLGSLLMESGEAAEAERAYLRALDIDPQMAEAKNGLGSLRLEEGKIRESVELFSQVIERDPENLPARFQLIQAEKVRPGDPNLAAIEQLVQDVGKMNDDKKISLHYALGKAYDDLKEYDKGFPHYLEGARLKRTKFDYDPQQEANRTQRLISVADRAFVERLKGAGCPSRTPIFVLGMPRSGTTLTEQIIASHPEVFGAGELRDLIEVIQTAPPGRPAAPFPENLALIDKATVTAWGEAYLDRLQRRAPTARHITDKMPSNHLALGLIPLMLPNAKIVHVRRNPVDTCLSCFTRLFNKHQEPTYDLAEVGRHYVNYMRLMEHWRRVLPPGSFYEIQYEAVVADMEGEARKLIDYCGLEWNDACLSFHQTKRNIRTASVIQVRQPIYTSSVERWRHYEKFLGPLLDVLGEYCPPR